MITLEAIEAPRLYPRWTAGVDLLLRMLHGLTISDHPYTYLVAIERHFRSRA